MKDPNCYKHVLFEDLKPYLRRDQYLEGFTTIEQAYIRHNIGAIGSQDIEKELAKLSVKVHEVTHSEFTDLIYQKKLELGSIYLITDYQTIYPSYKKENGKYITWGLNINPSTVYKLVCVAIDSDKIMPNVQVIENGKLKPWIVLYDPLYEILDDEVRTKGKIYYMYDENGNIANYDFKNIKFVIGDNIFHTFTNDQGEECSKDFYLNDLRNGYDIIIRKPISNLVCHYDHVIIEDQIVSSKDTTLKQIVERDNKYYLDYLDNETLTHQFYAIAKNTHIVA